MKATGLVIISCFLILLSSTSFSYSTCSSQSGCNSGHCNAYETDCQCTDPSCRFGYDSDCISRGACCEAFGNVGAR